MWQSSLAACGHVGVATRAGGVLFVTRRGVRVPAIVIWVLLIDSGRRVWTCLYKHVFFSRLAGGYSRWVSDLLVVRVWDVQG